MSVAKNKLDLQRLPGHLARRVHQLAVALFAQEIQEFRVTPIQYSTLQALNNKPGIDQKTLAATIGIDTSTIVGVLDRLEARGLVVRTVVPNDRRSRLIEPTEEGREMLAQLLPRVVKSQDRLLATLSPADAKHLMRIMQLLVDANEELSTVPAKD